MMMWAKLLQNRPKYFISESQATCDVMLPYRAIIVIFDLRPIFSFNLRNKFQENLLIAARVFLFRLIHDTL